MEIRNQRHSVTSQKTLILNYSAVEGPVLVIVMLFPRMARMKELWEKDNKFRLVKKRNFHDSFDLCYIYGQSVWETELPIFVQALRFHDVAKTQSDKNTCPVYQSWERRPQTSHTTNNPQKYKTE